MLIYKQTQEGLMITLKDVVLRQDYVNKKLRPYSLQLVVTSSEDGIAEYQLFQDKKLLAESCDPTVVYEALPNYLKW